MVGVCPHLLQNRGQKEPGVTQQLPPLQIICFTPPCCSYSCVQDIHCIATGYQHTIFSIHSTLVFVKPVSQLKGDDAIRVAAMIDQVLHL